MHIKIVEQNCWTKLPYTRHGSLLITPQSSEPSMDSIMAQVKTVPLFRRGVIRLSNRYFIQLPMELNELWKYWYENGAVLNIVIEVVEFKKASGNNTEASS